MVASETQPDIPGPAHSGKYITWDDAELRIVGCGTTIREAIEQAKKAGVEDPVVEYIPRTDCYFVGGRGRRFSVAVQPSQVASIQKGDEGDKGDWGDN